MRQYQFAWEIRRLTNSSNCQLCIRDRENRQMKIIRNDWYVIKLCWEAAPLWLMMRIGAVKSKRSITECLTPHP